MNPSDPVCTEKIGDAGSFVVPADQVLAPVTALLEPQSHNFTGGEQSTRQSCPIRTISTLVTEALNCLATHFPFSH